MSESSKNSSYYKLLGLTPTASAQDIRRAYRELSKLYHPDTTELPEAIATAKFQELNEAYATLSSPDRRSAYDLKLGYSRVSVIQPSAPLNRSTSDSGRFRSRAYLDPSDRPLSPGELFALFILGITFVGCLILVLAIGMSRGELAVQALDPAKAAETVLQAIQPPPSPPESVPSPEAELLPPEADADASSEADAEPPAEVAPVTPTLPAIGENEG